MGVFTGFEPMVFKVSEQIQGIEVDLARLVCDVLQRPLEVKTYRFTELIPALEAGEIDVIMSGLSVTDERKQRVSFTQPYLEIGQMAIVRLEDASEFGQPMALTRKDLIIGVHQGSTGQSYVRKTYPTAAVVEYGGVESALEGLRDGKVDVFIHDSTTSWQLGRSFVNDNLLSLNRLLTRESIAWAVGKDNTLLRDDLNAALHILKDRGKVNEVVHHWLPALPMTL